MNGRQRATRLAEQISNLQRLQKQFKGSPDTVPLCQAIERLVEARNLALADRSEDDNG